MIDFTGAKAITIPEGPVKRISRKSDGEILWEKIAYKNWVPLSTTDDGKTIYNGGLGYKNGYRVRSGGAEQAAWDCSHTGFIPVREGYVIGIGGASFDLTGSQGSTTNAINVYDASFTNLGQVVENYQVAGYGIFSDGKLSNWLKGTHKDGCFYWTVPAGANIAYVRVSGKTMGDGSKLIVTLNEEIV